jgi:hypothetical protein
MEFCELVLNCEKQDQKRKQKKPELKRKCLGESDPVINDQTPCLDTMFPE